MELSIICPVYNTEKYLKRCIESVLSQSFGDFEFLLVDDGSTDDSRNICMDYAQKDSRIRVLINDKKGVSSARNKGIRESKGKYIIFIDSDDALSANACETLMRRKKGVDLVASPYYIVLADGKMMPHNYPSYKGDMKGFLKNIEAYYEMSNFNGPCAKLFNRNILIENKIFFPENIDLGEDAYFVLLYLRCIENICLLSEPTYYRFIRKNSLSGSRFRKEYYESKLDMNILLAELCAKHTGMDNQELLYKYDRRAYRAHLNQFVFCKKNESAMDSLKSATVMKRTRRAFESGKGLNWRDKIVRLFVKKRCFYLLWLFGRIHGWLMYRGVLSEMLYWKRKIKIK